MGGVNKLGTVSVEVAHYEDPVVYITSFPPFWYFLENNSDKVRDLLDMELLENKLGVRIVAETLECDYSKMKTYLPARLQELKPKLSIHMGLYVDGKCIKLEKRARNKTYDRQDDKRFTPTGYVCVPGGPDVIYSRLDTEKVCDAVQTEEALTVLAEPSDEAGEYICGYVYYLSLRETNGYSVFIHVPQDMRNEGEIRIPDVTATVAFAIEKLYRQLEEME